MHEFAFKGLPLIRVTSVAGLETCVEIPSWDLCLDIGRCPPSAVTYSQVYFTHGHIDHMVGVVYHCGNRAFFGLQPPVYGMPSGYVVPFHRMMETDFLMFGHYRNPLDGFDRVPFDEYLMLLRQCFELNGGRVSRPVGATSRGHFSELMYESPVEQLAAFLVEVVEAIRVDASGQPLERNTLDRCRHQNL